VALRFTVLATAAAILTVGVAACGSKGGTTNTDSTVAPTRTVVSAAAPVRRRRSRQAPAVKVARTTYGRVLVDRRGFALYLFTHDRSAGSTCYGACAAAWPPYVVAKRPPRGIHGLVGSVRRRDGRLQVTYAGHPLYYYVGDRRPGEVLCQAVSEYGGTWYVIAPDGRAVH
jgi:predicted lipoprotein with Yx(FWY)xxD motif